MENNFVFLGTELKLNLHIEPIKDLTMKDYDFTVEAYCSSRKSLVLKKVGSNIKELDSNNYILLINTAEVGPGILKCKVTALLPDTDFKDNIRTEVSIIDTGIEIIKSI